jgi:hypothetical protein
VGIATGSATGTCVAVPQADNTSAPNKAQRPREPRVCMAPIVDFIFFSNLIDNDSHLDYTDFTEHSKS